MEITPSNIATIDVDDLTPVELSRIIYHIATHSQFSGFFTQKFITKCLLRASVLLEYDTVISADDSDEISSPEPSCEGCIDPTADCNEIVALEIPCKRHAVFHYAMGSGMPCEYDPSRKCHCCPEGREYCNPFDILRKLPINF